MVSLLLALVIIAILFAIYYGGGGKGQKSVQQTGKKAVEDAQNAKTLEIENNIEIQNELNSIGP